MTTYVRKAAHQNSSREAVLMLELRKIYIACNTYYTVS